MMGKRLLNQKDGLMDWPLETSPIMPVTKNYCVTWKVRVYANLVQKLRVYLISLCYGD